MGGKGDISVTANVAPKLMSEMCAAAIAGDEATAATLDAKLGPVHDAMFVEANPIPVKWALGELGLMADALRLPMTPLAPVHRDTVRNALQKIGVH
jgi:4-hydroxy-tetrahydrodipicolinate synthase